MDPPRHKSSRNQIQALQTIQQTPGRYPVVRAIEAPRMSQVFSPFKPATAATPQIMSKRSIHKRVQQVRELSVKKSLLASDRKLEHWSQSFHARSVEPSIVV